jgi:hypothetical protein
MSYNGANSPTWDPDYEPADPYRVHADGIDRDIRARRGVNWTIKGEKGKVPKCPAAPHRNASSNDAGTWGSFEEALAVAQDRDDRGVGLPCEDPGHPFLFLDIDIPADGLWVPSLSGLGDATVEYSPSGNLRVILRDVTVSEWWTNQSGDGKGAREVKVFADSGYITLTGDLVEGVKAEVGETTQVAFEVFLKEVWRAFNPDHDAAPPWKGNEGADATTERMARGQETSATQMRTRWSRRRFRGASVPPTQFMGATLGRTSYSTRTAKRGGAGGTT